MPLTITKTNLARKQILQTQKMKARVKPPRHKSSVSFSKNAYVKMMVLRTRAATQDQPTE